MGLEVFFEGKGFVAVRLDHLFVSSAGFDGFGRVLIVLMFNIF